MMMANAAAKATWRRKEVVAEMVAKPAKIPSDHDRTGGESPGRMNLQKRRSCPSSTGQKLKAKRIGAVRGSPSSALKRRGVRKEKHSSATDCERIHSKPSRSKSSSTDRANAHHSAQRKSGTELPPYIKATIAEQLAPPRSRPPREDTKENLFGHEVKPRQKPSNARFMEDTQKSLFGEPEPLLAPKSSRHLADTKHNLFGPPPEVPRRTKSRLPCDTPDILSHEVHPQSEFRETQLNAIVGRYDLRHQDTHHKLFGAPEAMRPPPPVKPSSNIFYHDDMTSRDEAFVKSLPLGSVIVITRDVQSPRSLHQDINVQKY